MTLWTIPDDQEYRIEDVARRGNKKCQHGKQKSRCVDCGGAGICEHKRRRTDCKDCDGSSICPHQKRRADCKDCDGSAICEHGNYKYVCVECGGAGLCEHGKQKAKCAKSECSGCKHDRMNCFICDPEGRAKRSKYMDDYNAGAVGKKYKRD